MRLPSQLRTTILALAVAWAAAGLLYEVNARLSAFDERGFERTIPALWHFGTRPPARLAACLAEVARRVPAGRTVSIYSQPGPGEAEFYRWRWAAYLLPLHDVLVEDATRGATPRDFLVAVQRPIESPELILVFQRPGCGLYRVIAP